ncbi:MAG: hypothetical protein COB14_08725 [Alphaproteobacteria bacterium]|nr:MAG: hypothetical protein COB14_08725 [Alphaproteobacteria bacterium]
MYQKLRQYFKSREANSRFENTEPFELDPKIRIAYDEKDLVVIHHPEVKAVLWKRDIDPKISDDLCQYEADQSARKHGQQVVKNLNGVDILYDNSTPDSIAYDVADVNKSFNRATYSSATAHIKYFHSSTDSKQEDRASMVHVDDNFTLRALVCYTLDINAATQYYPGFLVRTLSVLIKS